MTAFKDAWLAHQRKRWMRHDAHRWLRHDAYRFLPPGMQRNLRGISDPDVLLAFLEGKAGFNPDQPRVPAGHPGGGQWTAEGGGGSAGQLEGGAGKDDLTDSSASRRSAPRFARPKGHHFVAREVYREKELSLSPEAQKVFANATTGPLRAQRHGWTTEHRHYNQAVKENLKKFINDNGIDPGSMTSGQAQDFVDSIKRSGDPRIRDFNMKIYRRELQFLLRYGPRRAE